MEYSQCVEEITSAIEKILKTINIKKIDHYPLNDIVENIDFSIKTIIFNNLIKHLKTSNIEFIPQHEKNKKIMYYNLVIDENDFGTVSLNINLKSNNLFLTLFFKYGEDNKKFNYPINHIITQLKLPKNKTTVKLSAINPKTIIMIDFEWLQSYKKMDKVSPLVSEFGFIVDDNYFYSDHLWIHPSNLNKINKILLKIMGISKEELLTRHNSGSSLTHTWTESLMPIFYDIIEKYDKVVFLSFGESDHIIIKELIKKKYNKHIIYCDFREEYQTQLGQESLLQGLGANFTHKFHAGNDVKALAYIYKFFRQAEDLNEVHTLECLIRLNKNIVLNKEKEKAELYMKLFLKDNRINELWNSNLNI